VILTVAVVLPNAFVAKSVYVVDWLGETTVLVPRTAPMSGETIKYDAPVTFQLKVTGAPAETDCELAVKLAIAGLAPAGTFAAV
jgi:hypothetical protein